MLCLSSFLLSAPKQIEKEYEKKMGKCTVFFSPRFVFDFRYLVGYIWSRCGAYACNSSFQEAEAERLPQLQGHSGLPGKFQATFDYRVRFCLRNGDKWSGVEGLYVTWQLQLFVWLSQHQIFSYILCVLTFHGQWCIGLLPAYRFSWSNLWI